MLSRSLLLLNLLTNLVFKLIKNGSYGHHQLHERVAQHGDNSGQRRVAQKQRQQRWTERRRARRDGLIGGGGSGVGGKLQQRRYGLYAAARGENEKMSLNAEIMLQVERTVAGFRVLLPSTKKEQLTTISGHRSREWRALRSISHPYYLQRVRDASKGTARGTCDGFGKRSSTGTPETEAGSVRGYSTGMIVLVYGRRGYADEATRLPPYYKIIGSFDNYYTILSKVPGEGMNFEPDNSSEFLPNATIEVYNFMCWLLMTASYMGSLLKEYCKPLLAKIQQTMIRLKIQPIMIASAPLASKVFSAFKQKFHGGVVEEFQRHHSQAQFAEALYGDLTCSMTNPSSTAEAKWAILPTKQAPFPSPKLLHVFHEYLGAGVEDVPDYI
ncbi:hypothetical protein AHAS_Ahas12G0277300 [Arachis hypogaea]